jgi:hypothetical protein
MRAIADLIVIGFFWLLRPGEYCATTEGRPFTAHDVQMCINSTVLNLQTCSEADLFAATKVSLVFVTQKNGERNEIITHGRNTICGDICPCRAIARRILHLRNHNALPDAQLCRFYCGPTFGYIHPQAVTDALRAALTSLGPAVVGIKPKEIESRSLRAGGACAMQNGGIPAVEIKNIGRWHSDVMLRYLHNAANPRNETFASRMYEAGFFQFPTTTH